MNNGRAKIEHIGNDLIIEVPSKKNWFVLIFATFWLGGWAFGLLTALGFLSGASGPSGTSFFMLFWVCAWSVAGAFIITMLLWGYFGKERLAIKHNGVTFEKTVFGIGLKNQLDYNPVTNFRLHEVNDNLFGGSRYAVYGMGPGRIKFDYGFKTYSFGLALDEAEANHLIDLLNKKVAK